MSSPPRLRERAPHLHPHSAADAEGAGREAAAPSEDFDASRVRKDCVATRLEFGHARVPGQQLEILSLRLRAHQHYGHLTEATAFDLASPFDEHSRHLVCRSGEGRIIGYVRL